MFNDKALLNQNGDSLVFVFNYPFGYCHLAQMLEIDSQQWVAKSEVIHVLSKPAATQKEIDCGEIITPRLDDIAGIKDWAEFYLNQSWVAVIQNILQIQELQIKDYEFELQCLKYQNAYNGSPITPFSQRFYAMKAKISKVKRATTLLHSVLAQTIQ